MRGNRRIRLIVAIGLVAGATVLSVAGLQVQAEEPPPKITEVTGIPVPGGRGPILVPLDDQSDERSREPRQLP